MRATRSAELAAQQFRTGDRVRSRHWRGWHGTVDGAFDPDESGASYAVLWDGDRYVLTQEWAQELAPSRRPAPRRGLQPSRRGRRGGRGGRR